MGLGDNSPWTFTPTEEEFVRKKAFLSVVTAATVLAAAAVALAGPNLVQVAEIGLTSKKVGKPTGIAAVLSHTDPDAQPPGNIPATIKIVVNLPSGTRVNDNAAPQCNVSSTDLANAKCPESTLVGTGKAKANVVFGAEGPVEEVDADVTAFNREGGLGLRVVSRTEATVPSTTIPIIASLSPKGVLTANVPVLRPAGPTSKVILSYLSLNVKRTTKKVGRGRKRKTISLLTSPRKCSGNWTTKTVTTYDDGDSRTVPETRPCIKPPTRGR